MDSSVVSLLDPVSSRDWLETLHLLSGVVVAAVSMVALWALVQAKRDITIRSRRESVVLAAKLCERYAEELIPRCEGRWEKLLKHGIKSKNWEMADSKFQQGSIVDKANAQNWIDHAKKYDEDMNTLAAMSNDLEAFAIYFIKRAADEQVAFTALGAIFCDWTQKLAPYLAMARSPERRPANLTSGPYQNLIDLYNVWIARMTKGELERAASEIKERLEDLDDRGPEPIGT